MSPVEPISAPSAAAFSAWERRERRELVGVANAIFLVISGDIAMVPEVAVTKRTAP